ncbi:MAG: glycosyltransferase [Eggerthellaceae bacterium]|nr:glycosyltransferase [Eggerthellaceae bacterium]
MATRTQLPKITVVVPLYNCEPYIGECLESLVRQSLPDFEVICVDDASTDGSLGKARACAGADPRFSFVALEENRGQSAARNAALGLAQGDYIVFLDSDDYLVDDALEKLVARATAQNLDDLYFSARSFFDSKDSQDLFWEDLGRRAPFDGVATGKELFTVFAQRREFFPHGPLRMVRRSLIEDHHIRFYEGIIHEDDLFTFQTLVASERSSFLSDVLYMRRVRLGSTMATRTQGLATVKGYAVCVREMKRWMRDNAADLDDTFIEAMMRQIDWLVQQATQSWYESDDEQAKADYLASLPKADRVDFYADFILRGEAVEQIKEDILRPGTRVIGDAFVRALRLVKRKALQKYRLSRT